MYLHKDDNHIKRTGTEKSQCGVSLYEGIIFLSYFKEKRIKKCQRKDIIQFRSYRKS